MRYYVRDIEVGERFILKRTGEIYTKLSVAKVQNKARHNVQRKGATKPTDLNHGCEVKPIYIYNEIFE